MDGWMDGWIDGWMDGWMDACMHACMHGCMDAWMHGCMDAWMHGWMDGCMDAWMHACMDAWMHGCMDAWMHGWMDAWNHGCMDAWMHGCMDAWMHGCMDAWMHVEFNLLHSAFLKVSCSAATEKGSFPTFSTMCWRSSSLTSGKSSATNWPAPVHKGLDWKPKSQQRCRNLVYKILLWKPCDFHPRYTNHPILVASAIATALPCCDQYQGLSPQLLHCSFLDLSFEGRQPIRSDPFCAASSLKQHVA